MKTLEIILRLFEKLLSSIFQKKAQDEADKLEDSPDTWFRNHFGGLQSKDDKANKAHTDHSE